jgi:hypothetical protein
LNLRQFALIGIAGLALGGTAIAGSAATVPVQVAQAGPGLPTPAPSTTPGGRRRRAATPEPSGSPSETPEPPQFQTMDGVWEVAMQPLDASLHVKYSHIYMTQKSDQLSGTWVRADKDVLEFTGTFDGRLFKMALKDKAGNSYTMSGYAENFADMVGLFLTSDPKDKGIPFTAAHRKREKLS